MAHINGKKDFLVRITRSNDGTKHYDGNPIVADAINKDYKNAYFRSEIDKPIVVKDYFDTKVPLRNFGNATKRDVRKGRTFTSIAGVLEEGTYDRENGIIGTWVFSDVLSIPDEICNNIYNFTYYIDTDMFGVIPMFDMSFSSYGGVKKLVYGIEPYEGNYYIAYTESEGAAGSWSYEKFKTITIDEDPTDETFIAWLKANATKVSETESEYPKYDGRTILAEVNSYTETHVNFVAGFDTTTIVDRSVQFAVPLSTFGDAKPSDVRKGVTFTSSEGLEIYGTNEGDTETPILVTSSFDNTGDGILEVYSFYKELPVRFNSSDVIQIDAVKDITDENGVQQEAGRYSHYIKYDEIATGTGTMPYAHVYCLDNSNQYLRYSFNVEKEGIYELAAHLRIKDEQLRGATYTINKGTSYEHVFVTTYGWNSEDEALAVRNNDNLQGAYMSGMQVHLHSGINTIHITPAVGVTKNQHFRNLYLVKTADLCNHDLTMDKAEAMGVGLAKGAKLPEYYYIKVTFNNDPPRSGDGFCRVTTSNNHKMSIQKITLSSGQAMPSANETVILRGKIGCVNSTVNGSIGQEARIFDATVIGVDYTMCEIVLADQDCSGIFSVTYEEYEYGKVEGKLANVPVSGDITINAIQGTKIKIQGVTSGLYVTDENDNPIDTNIDYADYGTTFMTVPNMSKCIVWIAS